MDRKLPAEVRSRLDRGSIGRFRLAPCTTKPGRGHSLKILLLFARTRGPARTAPPAKVANLLKLLEVTP